MSPAESNWPWLTFFTYFPHLEGMQLWSGRKGKWKQKIMVEGIKFWHPLKHDVFEIYSFPYPDLEKKNIFCSSKKCQAYNISTL